MTLKEGINDYHRTEADCSRGSQGHRDCNACCEVGASGGIAFGDRNISRSTPAAILHIGSITVELYEGTSAQMLENILKAVQSC